MASSDYVPGLDSAPPRPRTYPERTIGPDWTLDPAFRNPNSGWRPIKRPLPAQVPEGLSDEQTAIWMLRLIRSFWRHHYAVTMPWALNSRKRPGEKLVKQLVAFANVCREEAIEPAVWLAFGAWMWSEKRPPWARTVAPTFRWWLAPARVRQLRNWASNTVSPAALQGESLRNPYRAAIAERYERFDRVVRTRRYWFFGAPLTRDEAASLYADAMPAATIRKLLADAERWEAEIRIALLQAREVGEWIWDRCIETGAIDL